MVRVDGIARDHDEDANCEEQVEDDCPQGESRQALNLDGCDDGADECDQPCELDNSQL